MTYKILINQFFQQHEQKLLQLYPGLSERRLVMDYIDFVASYPHEEDYLTCYPCGEEKEKCEDFLQELLTGKPLEYITKKAYFSELVLNVDERVLIPRQETELLVFHALKKIQKARYKRILDLGTGSGAVALALAHHLKGLNLEIVASDISKEALCVAKQNIEQLKYCLGQKITTIQSDLFENIQGQFGLIVSNPPYIKRKADRELVHSQVHDFEPHLALFLDDHSYQNWFSKLFHGAYSGLCEGGCFMMEGHEKHLLELSNMMKEIGFQNVSIIKDLGGNERFVVGEKLGG